VSFPTELRHAVRSLLKSPGFTAMAVVTLALGVGATTAIFSVVRGVLLEPLPYPAADRIVQLWQLGDEGQQMQWAAPNFRDVREQNRSFEAMAAYYAGSLTVTGAGDAARVSGAGVSEDFFAVLGVQPMRGRGFLADDYATGAAVALVSYGYWQGALGGDPDVVGRVVRVEGSAHEVVGVLPDRHAFPAGTQIWTPVVVPAEASRTAHNWRAIARLSGDVSVEGAERDLGALGARLKQLHGPDTWMASATAIPLHAELVGDVRPALLTLLSAAALLLLIACANVANLLLARAASRTRELAVRLALGASRGRILQQLLAESSILAFGAGVLGVLVAIWGVDALMALEPGRLPRTETIGVDWLVLVFAIGVSAAAAVGIGLVATLRAVRADVRDALAEGGRGGTDGIAAGRLRGALVAAQVALTLVLLVGAGLLSRSFIQLITLDPGYRTSGALALDLTLPGSEGPGDDPLFAAPPNPTGAAALEEMLTRVRALPGAEAAGGINALPLSSGGANGKFLVLQQPDEVQSFDDWRRLTQEPGRTGFADYRVATPGYFEAMEIPLVRGRVFDAGDREGPLHAALVTESLAESQWPDEDPIGKLIQFGNMDGVLYPFTVVGVVGDARYRSLEAPPQPTLYGNAYQRSPMIGTGFDLVVSGGAGVTALMPAVRTIVRDVTPDGPFVIRPFDEIFAGSLAERRFSLLLLGVLAAVALLLAAVGIYGVISFTVAQRTREIGIRMALGARESGVLRLMIREALVLTGIGLLVGIVLAWGATRVLASQLYGVGTLDPITFAAVGLILAVAAVTASYVPARRATRIDPVTAFRGE